MHVGIVGSFSFALDCEKRSIHFHRAAKGAAGRKLGGDTAAPACLHFLFIFDSAKALFYCVYHTKIVSQALGGEGRRHGKVGDKGM